MKNYLSLLNDILVNGRLEPNDRTGVGRLRVFGRQLRFDLSKNQFPLLTSRQIFTRGMIEETLMFLRGDTNVQEHLTDKNIHIWDLWMLKEDYTEPRVLTKYERTQLWCTKYDRTASDTSDFFKDMKDEECHKTMDDAGIPKTTDEVIVKAGEIGPMYGAQWRSWPTSTGDYIDQLQNVIDELKDHPASSRLVVSAWNVEYLPVYMKEDNGDNIQENIRYGNGALAPCHCLFQFFSECMTIKERVAWMQLNDPDLWTDYVGDRNESWKNPTDEEIHNWLSANGAPQRKLSCQLYQRSVDAPAGMPFNVASYSLITAMIAQVTNHARGEFVWTGGDIHVYTNQLDIVAEHIRRETHELPELILNNKIHNIDDFTTADIMIKNYTHSGKLNYPVAM